MKIIDKVINKIKYKNPWDKFYDKDKRTIEVPNVSVYEYLRDCNKDNLDSIAINYFNKKMTYRTFLNEINVCARALRSQGIREGDVVTICMPNTPEAVIAFYATNEIGAIANMVHPLSAEEEIKHSLISTKSVMLIAINLSYKKVKEIIEDTDVYKTIIVSASDSMPTLLKIGYNLTSGRKIEKPKKSETYMYWHDFIEKGKHYSNKVLVKTTKEQPAAILHSGGTTGTPKNIVLTNGNIVALAKQATIIFPKIGPGDSILTILPLFHCFGLCVCVNAVLCLGGTNILIPQFDAKRFDKLFSSYRPTIVAGVPTLYEALLTNKHMDNMNLSYVKYVISGGDSLVPEKNEAVNKFFRRHGANISIIQGYGMTETGGPVCAQVLDATVPGSIGIPFPSNEIKIVNPDTKEEVPYGETGEICIHSPATMAGYLDNEKETNEILQMDKKGKIWVHTGDLGYMTEDGIVFYVSRLKRMLIVSGYNVYPSHIENVLMKHPDVLNCGVIGIPHPYKVQVPKAYIVLDNGVKDKMKVRNDIKEYCKKNLAAYMVPKEFEFRESLPKTMIGKVNYRELEKENKK
ncbi:MAG: AMP-binding protein [Bacilli bacterium]|nr:AMP-binding protein [Bacilli bacterium]